MRDGRGDIYYSTDALLKLNHSGTYGVYLGICIDSRFYRCKIITNFMSTKKGYFVSCASLSKKNQKKRKIFFSIKSWKHNKNNFERFNLREMI